MQPIEIRDVAQDLERAAKYYLEDAFKDRLSGKLREWFDAALNQRGMESVVEIAEPAAVFVDANPGGDGTMLTTIGDKSYTLTRVITTKVLSDVDDIRVRADKFCAQVQEAVGQYVESFPLSAAVAVVPTLYVHVQAFVAEWLLWGYAGTPNASNEPLRVGRRAQRRG